MTRENAVARSPGRTWGQHDDFAGGGGSAGEGRAGHSRAGDVIAARGSRRMASSSADVPHGCAAISSAWSRRAASPDGVEPGGCAAHGCAAISSAWGDAWGAAARGTVTRDDVAADGCAADSSARGGRVGHDGVRRSERKIKIRDEVRQCSL